MERRITNSIAPTNNDYIKIRRSWVPARTRFGGLAVSAILILSSLLLAVQINQSAWAGTFPGPNGQIAFGKGSGMDPDADEIYVMDADGSEQTQLTDNEALDESPSWSPDGEKLAFTSYRDGNPEIYVMNADGTEETRLTNNVEDDLYPSWSPDGEKIAFASERDEEGNRGIYTMNADDGSDVTVLTTDGYDPSWSPDGEKIAFASERDVDDESEFNAVYTMDADDGSDVTVLTNPPNAHYATIDWGTNTSNPDGDDDKDKKHDQ